MEPVDLVARWKQRIYLFGLALHLVLWEKKSPVPALSIISHQMSHKEFTNILLWTILVMEIFQTTHIFCDSDVSFLSGSLSQWKMWPRLLRSYYFLPLLQGIDWLSFYILRFSYLLQDEHLDMDAYEKTCFMGTLAPWYSYLLPKKCEQGQVV